jgi:DNA-binding beta-propeller fold protein YncE
MRVMKRALVLLVFAAGCQHLVYPASGSMFSQPEQPAWTHQARFAVTDNRSDLLSVVTAGQPTVSLLANVPVGDNPVELEGPHHLAASPDGAHIYFNLSNYVPGSGSGPHGSHGLGDVPGSLVKLDARTMTKVGEVLVDPNPGDVILNSSGTLAFVSHYDLLKLQQALFYGQPAPMAYSAIIIIDTASMTQISHTPTCITAHGMGLSADEKTLYVSCAQSDQMAVLDISDPGNPKVSSPLIPVGPGAATYGTPPVYGPYAVAVSPVDGSVWLSDNNSGDVRCYDPVAGHMDPRRTVPVGGVAMFGAFSADGKTLFVPHQGDDQVSAISMADLSLRNLPLPPSLCLNTHMLVFTPDHSSAVIVCEGDHATRPGSILAMDPAAFVITGGVDVGLFPDGAAYLPPLP